MTYQQNCSTWLCSSNKDLHSNSKNKKILSIIYMVFAQEPNSNWSYIYVFRPPRLRFPNKRKCCHLQFTWWQLRVFGFYDCHLSVDGNGV